MIGLFREGAKNWLERGGGRAAWQGNMSVGETLLAIGLYGFAINTASFLAFAWDKHCARNGRWRVSEQTLLTIAAIGGTIGAFVAARRLRHKTHKEPFRTNLRLIAVVQVIALAALSVPQVRDVVWQFVGDAFS
jgi:uncharacterized membrane protein YsdA (DUF1294 family)